MRGMKGTLVVVVGIVIGLTACAQNKQSIKPDQIKQIITATPTLTAVYTPTPIMALTVTPTVVPVVKKTIKKRKIAPPKNNNASRQKVVKKLRIEKTPVQLVKEVENDHHSLSVEQSEDAVRAEQRAVELINENDYMTTNVVVGDMVWTPTPIAIINYKENKQAGDGLQKKKSIFWPIFLIILAIISLGFLIMRNRKKQSIGDYPPTKKVMDNETPIEFDKKYGADEQAQQQRDGEEKKQAQLEAEERVRKESVLKKMEEEQKNAREEQLSKHDVEKADHKKVEVSKAAKEDLVIAPKVSIRSASKKIVKKPVAKPVKKAAKKTTKKVVKKAAKKVVKKTVKKIVKKPVKKVVKKIAKKTVTKKTVTKKTVTKKIVKKAVKKTTGKKNIIPFEKRKVS